MSAESVVAGLEALVGQQFRWDAGGAAGTLHHWLTTSPEGDMPDMRDGGMQCFGLPIRVALEQRCLSWDEASDLYAGLLMECAMGNSPSALCPNGITRMYYGTLCCIPLQLFNGRTRFERGDIVFFSTPGIKHLAHVAVATGRGTELISFGHGADGMPRHMTVESCSVQDLAEAFAGRLTTCYFGTPPW